MSGSLRFGLIASPLGAIMAGAGSYFAAARSCVTGHPATARIAFLVIAVIGLALATAGLVNSFGAWRSAAPTGPPDNVPDRETLSAFLARAGLISGVVLGIGLAYLVLGPLMVRACERIW
jgi:hypothetical protein